MAHPLSMAVRCVTVSEYIPSYVLQPIESATDAEKQQFVDLVNKFHSGELPKVANAQEFVQLIQKV